MPCISAADKQKYNFLHIGAPYIIIEKDRLFRIVSIEGSFLSTSVSILDFVLRGCYLNHLTSLNTRDLCPPLKIIRQSKCLKLYH